MEINCFNFCDNKCSNDVEFEIKLKDEIVMYQGLLAAGLFDWYFKININIFLEINFIISSK